MDPFLRRRIGKASFEVTQLGMGGASLGDMRESIPEAQATAAIDAAHAAGIGYFDTSPWYGNGKSELRFGHVLRTKPRDSFVLSTKVGRVHARPANPDTYKHPGWAGGLPFEPRFDYTRDGVLKSYEMSLARIGLNRVEALLIHDLDPRHQKSEDGVAASLGQLDAGGGYRALADLKAQGEIAAIGAGVNLAGMIPRFLERWPSTSSWSPCPIRCSSRRTRGAGDVWRARRFGGDRRALRLRHPGAGPQPGALYNYRPPSLRSSPRRSASQLSARHDVHSPRRAAVPFGHRSVVSVIPGPVATEEVRKNLAWMRHDIPDALWTELKVERPKTVVAGRRPRARRCRIYAFGCLFRRLAHGHRPIVRGESQGAADRFVIVR
jgi:D-threo-aldose 1-dehydrogenase